MPNFSFCEGREYDNGFLLLFLNFDTVSEFNCRKNCQDLTNWMRQNKRNKVWNSATSLFKWRFRSRRHRCCLSSLLKGQPALSGQLAFPKGWLLKGAVTRDDPQRRFLVQHSVATLLGHFFRIVFQHCNPVLKTSLRIAPCNISLKGLWRGCLIHFVNYPNWPNKRPLPNKRLLSRAMIGLLWLLLLSNKRPLYAVKIVLDAPSLITTTLLTLSSTWRFRYQNSQYYSKIKVKKERNNNKRPLSNRRPSMRITPKY